MCAPILRPGNRGSHRADHRNEASHDYHLPVRKPRLSIATAGSDHAHVVNWPPWWASAAPFTPDTFRPPHRVRGAASSSVTSPSLLDLSGVVRRGDSGRCWMRRRALRCVGVEWHWMRGATRSSRPLGLTDDDPITSRERCPLRSITSPTRSVPRRGCCLPDARKTA